MMMNHEIHFIIIYVMSFCIGEALRCRPIGPRAEIRSQDRSLRSDGFRSFLLCALPVLPPGRENLQRSRSSRLDPTAAIAPPELWRFSSNTWKNFQILKGLDLCSFSSASSAT
jgi:hypothetical protein